MAFCAAVISFGDGRNDSFEKTPHTQHPLGDSPLAKVDSTKAFGSGPREASSFTCLLVHLLFSFATYVGGFTFSEVYYS